MKLFAFALAHSVASQADEKAKDDEKVLNGLQQFYLNQNKENVQKPEKDPKPESETQKSACFTCSARDLHECQVMGTTENCRSDQVCQIELRKRDSQIESVIMGCKEHEACVNQQTQNFQSGNFRYNQCKPKSKIGPSVCWSCCKTDINCFETFSGLSTVAEWKKFYV